MPEPIPIPSAVTPVRRALVSVHDKTGIAELGRALSESGVQLVSTGGTAATLKAAGVEVSLVEETTGFPEILGGRVKTLHPKIFGGVLADETREDHARDLEAAGIETVRPRDRQPLSLREDRRGRQEPVRDRRDDRRGRPRHDPGGGQEPRAGDGRGGPGRLPRDPRGDPHDGRDAPVHARAPGGPGLRPHGGLRRRDRPVLHGHVEGVRPVPRKPGLRIRTRQLPALRGEPAPARRALRLPVGAGRRPRALPDAPGQGALLQQPARPRLGASRSPATSTAWRRSS